MAYIGNTATTQAFTPAVDYFNGDGSTVAFTLSKPVASVAQVQAVIENVPQNPGSAYTVSGNTITFTSAPPSGTANIYVYYTSPVTQVIAPSQGTVGSSQLQSDLSLTGDLNLASTGARIRGDFSNATISNRVAFQTSTTNSSTILSVIPNGTSTQSNINLINNSNPTNASDIRMLVTSSEGSVRCGISGTGTYLPMTFVAGGSEKLRILTSGGITFNGDTAAANALDDYEEGTWTPNVGGTATYQAGGQNGVYTKIGNIVTVQFQIAIDTLGTGSAFRLSGLPFSSASISSVQTGCVSYWGTLAVNTIFLSLYVENNASTIQFVGKNTSGTTVDNGINLFGNATTIYGSATYRVA